MTAFNFRSFYSIKFTKKKKKGRFCWLFADFGVIPFENFLIQVRTIFFIYC